MRKICPRCQTPTDASAGFCHCGHRFRTPPPVERTQFLGHTHAPRPRGVPWWARFLLGIGICFLLLIFTNPSRQDFLDWFKGRLQEQPEARELDDSTRGPALNAAIATLDGLTEAKNLGVMTLYIVRWEDGSKARILGIARQIIPLDAVKGGEREAQPGTRGESAEPPPSPATPFPSDTFGDYQRIPARPTFPRSAPNAPGWGL